MNKLMLEALAAWLALAMASGQAAAAISATGAQIDSLPTIVSHGNGVSDGSRFAASPFLSNGAGLSPAPSIGATPNTLFLLPVPDPAAAPDGVTTRPAGERVLGRNPAVALLTPAVNGRSGTRSTKPTLFGVVDASQSSGAPFSFSLSGVDDFALGGKNDVRGLDLKRRALNQNNQHNVVGDLRGGLVRANVVSGQSKAVQTVKPESPEATEINLRAGAKTRSAAMVARPEPGSWSTLLAGVIGVLAIARHRTSPWREGHGCTTEPLPNRTKL